MGSSENSSRHMVTTQQRLSLYSVTQSKKYPDIEMVLKQMMFLLPQLLEAIPIFLDPV